MCLLISPSIEVQYFVLKMDVAFTIVKRPQACRMGRFYLFICLFVHQDQGYLKNIQTKNKSAYSQTTSHPFWVTKVLKAEMSKITVFTISVFWRHSGIQHYRALCGTPSISTQNHFQLTSSDNKRASSQHVLGTHRCNKKKAKPLSVLSRLTDKK